MEVMVLIPIVVLYFVVKALIFGTDDELGKEKKRFAEGMALLKGRNFQEGKLWFDVQLIKSPKSGLAWACRGECHLALGNIYEALSDLNNACKLQTDLPEAYLNKGKALYMLNDFENAFIELDKAVWHFRNNGEAFYYRAMVLLHMGDIAKANSDFRLAVSFGSEEANQYIRRQQEWYW